MHRHYRPPSDLALLLLTHLQERPLHALALLAVIEQRNGVHIEPGTLYRLLAECEQDGWIKSGATDDPLHCYSLTDAGYSLLAGKYSTQHIAHPWRYFLQRITGISLSIDWVLYLYPPAWRERYEAEMRALLEQHAITPFTILDMLFSALDAHMDPHFKMQRMSIPTSATNRPPLATIAFICMVPLFLIAASFWVVIVADPGGTLYSIFNTNTNPIANFSGIIVLGGILLTLLVALIGGLLVVVRSIRYTQTARRWSFLFAALLPLLMMPLPFVAVNIVGHASISLPAILMVALMALLCGGAFAFLAFQRSKMGRRILRMLFVPATITALTMPVVLLANIIWAVSLWSDIFQRPDVFIASTTFFSWLAGWAIDFAMMALPTLIVLIALIRARRSRMPASPQRAQTQTQSAMML